MELMLWIAVVAVIIEGFESKQTTRRLQTSKCHYTLVFREDKCPSMESKSQDDDHRISMVEQLMHEEKLTSLRLRDQISNQLQQLNDLAANLQHQSRNVTAVRRESVVLRDELTKQDTRWLSLEHKVAGLLLDVNEIHKQLERRDRAANDEKYIPVEDISTIASCTAASDAVTYTDCEQVYTKGHTKSGVYYIHSLYNPCPIPVYCDMETPPTGWMMIMKRHDGSLDFNRNWKEYGRGFGDINDEHFIGLQSLFLITNQKHYRLRIDLWDFYGSRVYAEYLHFRIDGERDRYRMHVSNHTGTAPDGLSSHDGMYFSTPDFDNDAYTDYHCAKEWSSGWWFSNCWFVFLTGQYQNSTDVEFKGIAWNDWKHEQLKRVEMKIKPSGY